MDAVLTIATVPAILALVQLAKDLGLNGKGATVLAVVLGVLLNVAVTFLSQEVWFQAVAGGLLLGLSAAGVYDAAKLSATKPETVLIER